MKAALSLGIYCLFCVDLVGAQQYHKTADIQIGGTGGWDYSAADSEGRRLYVSHGTEVVVIDLDTHKILGRVSGLKRIHGITIDKDAQKGYISDGGANEVVEFDVKSLAVEKHIAAGQNPDAILFDAASKKVFAFNGKSEDISVIDAASGMVVKTLRAGGKPEFAAADGTGNVYFNVEDKSELGHIDSQALEVKESWPLAPCESPSGLAIDASAHRLFAVCDNGKMAVIDAQSGKVVATPAIGNGPDAAGFDSEKKLIFSSNGQDGTLSIVQEKDADEYAVVQTVKTQKGARTMAIDEKKHVVYLPDASFGPVPAATADNPHPRPSIQPGSFKLLVVSE